MDRNTNDFINLRIICCIALFLSSNAFAQYNEWRSEHVKWGVGANFNRGQIKNVSGDKKFVYKISGLIFVDIALSESDIFDSNDLYLQPFAEVALPFNNPHNKDLKVYTFGGGINLKKYLRLSSDKSRYYLLIGGKMDYLIWQLNYERQNQKKEYKTGKLDYAINVGAGVNITSQIDIFLQYSKGLGKVYAGKDLANMNRLNWLTIGIRMNFNRNWWFT